ncbi:hypothetical protein DFH06DRAFT_769500 [Mycena polygramma]|nr:hypothetical protein DFH06DRAFT_769500 [Mycena polygramma]
MLPEEIQKFNEQLGRVLQRSYRVPPAPSVGEVITGDPVLPLELEREIFEVAAAVPNYWTKQHVGDMALVLPQVCRRAQSWIEPLIYGHISFPLLSNSPADLAMFLETIDTRPATFFATHVKYLDFDSAIPLAVVEQVLRVCTGVVNLGCRYTYTSLVPLLIPLPHLRRLLVAKLVFPFVLRNADLPVGPWATSLTHLGLSRAINFPSDLAAVFAAFPALTHFAVDYRDDAVHYANALRGLISACPPRLRCIVLVVRGKGDYRAACQDIRAENIADARLCVHLGGWQTWSQRVPDMFVEADAKIAKLSQ